MFGDNANTVGATLSLSLIILVGIVYGRITVERRVTLIAWIVFPIIGTAIIMTGSRGSLLGLVLGITLLVLRDGTWETKIKMGSIVVLAVGFLAFTAFSNDSMRTRLERSFYQGDTSGRDKIHGHAWSMVFERPMLGWGPVYNQVELGSRLGRSVRDPHSLYLTVLTETGLVGFILFFGGIGLLVRAAWQARRRMEGALPMALIGCLVISFVSGSWITRKQFWLLAAYILASALLPRGMPRQVPDQFSVPTNVADQGSRTSASFPDAPHAGPRKVSIQQEGPG